MTRTRQVIALAVAAVSDVVSLLIAPFPVLLPLQWVVDIGTALGLFMLLGWRWVMLPGLLAEAIPGLDMVPLWLIVVAVIMAQDEIAKRKGEGETPKVEVVTPADVSRRLPLDPPTA